MLSGEIPQTDASIVNDKLALHAAFLVRSCAAVVSTRSSWSRDSVSSACRVMFPSISTS